MLGACKPCHYARTAIYRENNKKKNRAIEYAWVAKNKDRVKENQTAWRLVSKEKIKISGAKYYAGNCEKVKAASDAWGAANPERLKETHKKWKAANPDAVRAYTLNRRARKENAGGTLSKGLTKTLLKLQNGKCACCGKSLKDGYHADHIMPLSLGGENKDGNMQLLTPLCNLQKHAKHPNDFMRERGFLL